MSNFTQFMKSNKKKQANAFYPATKSLTDENGEPLLWEFRPLKTSEVEAIRDKHLKDIPIAGKPNLYRQKLDYSKYIAEIICTCAVCPDLHDVELQESYEVDNERELLFEMVNDPGEYQKLVEFVQNYSGYDTSLADKVDEAKN